MTEAISSEEKRAIRRDIINNVMWHAHKMHITITLSNLKNVVRQEEDKTLCVVHDKSEAGQGLLIALVALAVVVVAVVFILGPILTGVFASLQANLGPLGQ